MQNFTDVNILRNETGLVEYDSQFLLPTRCWYISKIGVQKCNNVL